MIYLKNNTKRYIPFEMRPLFTVLILIFSTSALPAVTCVSIFLNEEAPTVVSASGQLFLTHNNQLQLLQPQNLELRELKKGILPHTNVGEIDSGPSKKLPNGFKFFRYSENTTGVVAISSNKKSLQAWISRDSSVMRPVRTGSKTIYQPEINRQLENVKIAGPSLVPGETITQVKVAFRPSFRTTENLEGFIFVDTATSTFQRTWISYVAIHQENDWKIQGWVDCGDFGQTDLLGIENRMPQLISIDPSSHDVSLISTRADGWFGVKHPLANFKEHKIKSYGLLQGRKTKDDIILFGLATPARTKSYIFKWKASQPRNLEKVSLPAGYECLSLAIDSGNIWATLKDNKQNVFVATFQEGRWIFLQLNKVEALDPVHVKQLKSLKFGDTQPISPSGLVRLNLPNSPAVQTEKSQSHSNVATLENPLDFLNHARFPYYASPDMKGPIAKKIADSATQIRKTTALQKTRMALYQRRHFFNWLVTHRPQVNNLFRIQKDSKPIVPTRNIIVLALELFVDKVESVDNIEFAEQGPQELSAFLLMKIGEVPTEFYDTAILRIGNLYGLSPNAIRQLANFYHDQQSFDDAFTIGNYLDRFMSWLDTSHIYL